MNPVIFFPVAGERAFSPDEFVTRKQLAKLLKVSESTVDRWAKREVRPLQHRRRVERDRSIS